MALIDTARAEQLYAAMGPAIEISGGSAANTLVGIASFGGTAAFVGRVTDDQLGAVFGHDIRAAGVEFPTPPAPDGDAHRSLPDHRHARRAAHDEHVPRRVGPARARRRRPRARGERAGALPRGLPLGRARRQGRVPRAARPAHDAGNRVAFTLSDAFCVDRHRDEFLELVEPEVDVLFANEAEIMLALRGRRVRRRAPARAAPLRDRRARPAARRAR